MPLLPKPMLRLSSLLFLAAPALPAQAATYICKVDGKAAYSTIKVNSSCKESQMDGISDKMPDPPAEQAASQTNGYDVISEIWEREIYGSYDDIKILPSAAESVTNSAAPPKLEIRLRNQPAAASGRPEKPAPIRTAAPLYVPPAKPRLTRTQILQKEISNERAALVRTKAQLETARKKGGSIIELLQAVRDREANIRAIEREIGR